MKDCESSAFSKGLKKTKQRSAILEILQKNSQPVSAEQIFLELSEKKISASLSTVYRSLEAMAQKGVVTKINISSEGKALFELNTNMHRHYLVCLGCKKIIALDYCPLEGYEEKLEGETDFFIVGHRLDIFGYCPECRKKSGS